MSATQTCTPVIWLGGKSVAVWIRVSVATKQDSFGWCTGETEPHGGRMLPLHVTPYIMGLPDRIDLFEKLLGELTGRPQTWFATGKEVVSAWEGQQ